MSEVSIVWFRQDLRLADNPALAAAARRGAVVPVFIWAPHEEGDWAPGAASRWWLHHSLGKLDGALRDCGVRLVYRAGDSLAELTSLVRETGATAVFWNRRYEPVVVTRDTQIKATLREHDLIAESFNGALLAEPWDVKNQSGRPFQVFTPFWKTMSANLEPRTTSPLPALTGPQAWPRSASLDEFALRPKIPWDAPIAEAWEPGEAGAQRALANFLADAFVRYGDDRNRPDLVGTSRMSPYLHFGEITPHQIWHAFAAAAKRRKLSEAAWRDSQYLKELGWREFAHHLLHHFPRTVTEPLRPEFARFPWANSPAHLRAWQRGRTGVPLVDAGMRELWSTGWMHNRVRMVVASFLVKNLLLPWQEGTRWFWDTLVDADLPNNTSGWQWTAGCGADAAPYFRVFNPVSQGQKFDPDGDYVRRWVPELAKLPTEFIHAPWEAPGDVLAAANVSLGKNYPPPLVDLKASRESALAAYRALRG